MAASCTPSTFSPTLFGGEILAIDTNLVTNVTASIPSAARWTQPSIDVDNLSFCNVTVTYTHPGLHDEIHVETWLPLDNYNGMLHAFGGGGWQAGRNQLSEPLMTGAVGEGYAATSTDAGLAPGDDASWALVSEGNSNIVAIRNFGSVSLNDKSIIAKSLVESFYGEPPKYSYYTGCSQGGRQGLMLAQRYPNAYDGITALAPAMRLTHLATGLYWPTQAINNAGRVPHKCEFSTLTAAAIEHCDPLDGVVDGVVSNVYECLDSFDAFSVVGKPYNCTEGSGTVSEEAAEAITAIWEGYHTVDGQKVFSGLTPSSDLTNSGPYVFPGMLPALAVDCSSNNGTCTNGVNMLALPWYQSLILKDITADVSSFTHEELDDLSRQGFQEYDSLLKTDDVDLSKFKEAGGKMLTWHGLDDHLIPAENTKQYYDEVTEFDSDVQDYYRYYEVPGMSHCFGGPSGNPTGFFQLLRDWVEKDIVPGGTGVEVKALHGEVHDRIICPYPQKASLASCDDPARAECWACS